MTEPKFEIGTAGTWQPNAATPASTGGSRLRCPALRDLQGKLRVFGYGYNSTYGALGARVNTIRHVSQLCLVSEIHADASSRTSYISRTDGDDHMHHARHSGGVNTVFVGGNTSWLPRAQISYDTGKKDPYWDLKYP